MKKILFLLIIAISAINSYAATKYQINVGGVEVTSDNYSNVTGGDIKSGTVKYDPNNKILTLTNVTITRTGGSNYGVHNRDCDGLRIKIVGTCNVSSNTANALHLDKETTVEITSGSTLSAKISAGENYGRGVIYVNGVSATFQGPGTLKVWGQMKDGGSTANCATCGFEGTGKSSNSRLYFSNITADLHVSHDGIYKFRTVQFNNSGNDVKIHFVYGFRALYEIGDLVLGNAKCVSPADATFHENMFGGNDDYTHFTDDYGVIFSTENFPDANFRNYLRSLCSSLEQYLTKAQLQNLTSLNVSGKSISDLTGISLLYPLTSLDCSNNNISSLPELPSNLTKISCANNQLTSLPSLPSRLQELYCGGNKFTTLSITSYSNLKTLNVSNNTLLTSLTCFQNALTSLNVSGCTAMTSLDCSSNQLTSLSTLPSSLQVLRCNSNQITPLPSLPSSLQELYCIGNGLTSLPSLPSSLKILNCNSNELTSLPSLPSNIETIRCAHNNFTSLSFIERTKLKLLEVSNTNSLTSITLARNSALTSFDFTYCPALKSLTMQNLSSYNFSNLSLPSTIESFDCGYNSLTSLPTLPSGLKTLRIIGNNFTSLPTLPSGLKELYCGGNKLPLLNITGRSALKTLDVNNNSQLITLLCENNALTSLNVSGCTALTTLRCTSNKITALNVSDLTSLAYLYCGDNQLSTLDLTKCKNLITLETSENVLTSIYVTNCSALRTFQCYNNKLSALSVQGCNALHILNIGKNQIKGSSMTSLVNSLRTIPSSESVGEFYVYCTGAGSQEGNEITNGQLATARTKRWSPRRLINGTWVDIPDLRGDLNGDGIVDVTDVSIAIDMVLGKATLDLVADLDGNGEVDVTDVSLLIDIVLGK